MRGGGALGVGAVAAALLLAAGCSGSDDDGADAVSAPGTRAETSIAVTEPPSTDPPATTTVPTTTTATTTAAPSSTVDDDAATLAAVEEAYLDAHAAYLAAARDPSNPELRAEIERLFTGPNLERTTELLDSFVDRNYVAKPDLENPSRTEVLAGPQLLEGVPGFAELVVCETDTEAFYELNGGPDGSDALVTDKTTITRLQIRFELVETSWRSNSGEVLAELDEADKCGP